MDDNSNMHVIETIIKSIDIDGHLLFVDNLLNKYLWEDEKKENIKKSINLMREKKNDTNLYLGIVGEFSSGKSTFINSLLRDELLKSDVLQATTAAATLITYSENLNVEVEYNSGKVVNYNDTISFYTKLWRIFFPLTKEKIKSNIRNYIYKVTANEGIAKEINNVKINHPSKMLKNGLIIVDTPGTNVNNLRHEEVTKKAIKEICDAAVIIIPSNSPLSESIIRFIEDNLSDVISKCIFVVTKMDLLCPKERRRVLDYIKVRLQNIFNIQDVKVFSSAPLLLLNNEINLDENQEILTDEKQELLKESYKAEEEILNILREQRLLIQLQKLINLMNSMFLDLKIDLKNIETSYIERHTTLDQNKIKSLPSFISEQKNIIAKEIEQESISIKNEIYNIINKSKINFIQSVKSSIYDAKNRNKLQSFIKYKFKKYIKLTLENLKIKFEMELERLESIYKLQFAKFEDNFKETYESLEFIKYELDFSNTSSTNEISNELNNLFNKEFLYINKNANPYSSKVAAVSIIILIACMIFGTVALPGLGTILGSFIGCIPTLCINISNPVKKLKDKYFNEIEKRFGNSYDNTVHLLNLICEVNKKKAIDNINKVIDNYYTKYNKIIKDLIDKDECEKAELKKNIENIKKDIDELTNRKYFLEAIEKKLI